MENENKEIVPPIAHDNRSSVEMSINAKGQIAGKVKVYNDAPDIAYAEAEKLLENIQKKQAETQPKIEGKTDISKIV